MGWNVQWHTDGDGEPSPDPGISPKRLAKTDALDAKVLARFAEVIGPEPRSLADVCTFRLRELVVRRQQLIKMVTAERNRLKRASPNMKPRIRRHLERPEGGIASLPCLGVCWSWADYGGRRSRRWWGWPRSTGTAAGGVVRGGSGEAGLW